MVGRNEAKTAAAARSIMTETGSRTVSWHIADLASLEAVHELAARLRERHPRIDVLCNNAGAMFLSREVTGDNLERTFALNHLSYFTLTLGLLPSLLAVTEAPIVPGAVSRVINVSSRAHMNARIDLDDLQMSRRYSGWRAYCNSKLCNIWFTRMLARRVDPRRIVVHSLHPGLVRTRFAVNNGGKGRLLRRIMNLRSIDPADGARTLVWLATSAHEDVAASTGGYWYQCRPGRLSNAARDDARAELLWERSRSLAGIDVDAG